ncbi:hypothetical protein Leryth_023448 [Lithospermum erythrorhizon]|nr:hypothetical protein Leryth_023448 [Lithospermum erythrorhizon]
MPLAELQYTSAVPSCLSKLMLLRVIWLHDYEGYRFSWFTSGKKERIHVTCQVLMRRPLEVLRMNAPSSTTFVTISSELSFPRLPMLERYHINYENKCVPGLLACLNKVLQILSHLLDSVAFEELEARTLQ